MNDVPRAFQEALRLQKAGQTEKALALYTQILLIRPKTAEAHFQIGQIHAAAGDVAKARAAFSKAKALKPGEPAIEKALAALERAAPDGAALWRQGRPALAEPLLRKAGPSRPLAELLAGTGRPDEALEVLEASGDGSADALQMQARLLAVLRRPDAARAAMQKAVAAGAELESAVIALARALDREGESTAALDLLSKQLKRKPRAVGLLVTRAQILQTSGQLEAAEADLRAALKIAPFQGEAYRAYCAGRKITADDPILPGLEAARRKEDLPAALKWRLDFAWSKALWDMGCTEEVFSVLQSANRAQRQAYPYDFDQIIATARQVIANWRERMALAPRQGPEDHVIFVSGMPRSGTTLVETILGAHAKVQVGGELPFGTDAFAIPFDLLADRAIPADVLAEGGARYVAAARRRIGAPAGMAFTDKAIATFTRLGPMWQALPGARFVILSRDPGDIGLSIYRNMLPDGLHRFSNSLRDIGRYIRLQEAMVAAWQEIAGVEVVEVSYEALTADPEVEIPKLVAAVGLDWDPACLSPETADTRVSTLSFAQVRQPIYRSSVAGWRVFETELEPLFAGLETKISLL